MDLGLHYMDFLYIVTDKVLSGGVNHSNGRVYLVLDSGLNPSGTRMSGSLSNDVISPLIGSRLYRESK